MSNGEKEMNRIVLGAVIAFVTFFTACDDSSSSDVYSCDVTAIGYDEHLCYESVEEDFMPCSDEEQIEHATYKHAYKPGRGCPKGELLTCEAEYVPGHPYSVYVYSKEIAQMGCRRVVPYQSRYE